MKKKESEKIYDPKVAIIVADDFRKHSKTFVDSLPKADLNEVAHFAVNNLGGLIASATMLALALELYLKALRITIALPVNETHHLWSLYKDLPVEIKSSIETYYNQLNVRKPGKTAGLILKLSVDPINNNDSDGSDESEQNKRNSRDDLKSLLVKSSDAFITWRYIHEGGRKGKYMYYDYEFLRLDLMCDIIRNHIIAILEKR